MTEADLTNITETLDTAFDLSEFLSDSFLRRLESVSDILDRRFGPQEKVREVVEDWS